MLRSHLFLFYCMCMLMSKTMNINILNALSQEAKRNINSVLNIGRNILIQGCKKYLKLPIPQNWLRSDSAFRWLTVKCNMASAVFSTSVSYGHHVVICLYANIFCCKIGFCFAIRSPCLVQISLCIVENNTFLYSYSVTAQNTRQRRQFLQL